MFDLLSEILRLFFTILDRKATEAINDLQDSEARIQAVEDDINELETTVKLAEKILNEAKLANQTTLGGGLISVAEFEEKVKPTKTFLEKYRNDVLPLKEMIEEKKRRLRFLA